MRHNIFRYLLAAIFIGIGVLLVMENFGVATFNAKNMWVIIYPVIFIVYGLKTMIDYFRYRGGSWIFGSFLFIFGTLLMLDRFGLFSFVFKDVIKLWPLLIVYLGFAFIRPKRSHRYSDSGRKGKHGYYYGPYDYTKHYYDQDYYKKHARDKAKHYKNYYKDEYHSDVVYDVTEENEPSDVKSENEKKDFTKETGEGTDSYDEDQEDKDDNEDDKHQSSRGRKGRTHYRNSFFSIGDFEYSQDNWKVEPMRLSNLAGDFYFDFTKAFIPEKEIPISISALAGDVRILMPENIEFRVAAEVKAGDINVLGEVVDGINRSLFFETENYHAATRKLDLTLKLKAGSVRIDSV